MAHRPGPRNDTNASDQNDEDRPLEVIFGKEESPARQKTDRREARAAKIKDRFIMKNVSWIIVLGDTALLLIFALGGEVSHELYFPDSLVLSVLHAALPFALAWFPVAFITRALVDPRESRRMAWVARTVGAWLIAAPLGIVVRGWLINRAVIPMAFLLVTYAMGLALFVSWRLIFIFIARLNSQKNDQTKGAE